MSLSDQYPQYTRPEIWEDKQVPPILLSGDHAKVDAWRLEKSKERTKERRPDLYEIYEREHPIIEKKKRRKKKISVLEEEKAENQEKIADDN